MVGDDYAGIKLDEAVADRFAAGGRAPDESALASDAARIAALDLGTDSRLPGFGAAPGVESSATAFMAEAAAFADEMRALHAAARRLDRKVAADFDRIEGRLAVASQNFSDTMLSLCGLQTARRNGLSYVVAEPLVNLLGIDQLRTTVDVDLGTSMARLRTLPGATRHDLTDLVDSDFNVFLSSGTYVGMSPAPGSHPASVVEDTDDCWCHRVYAKDDAPKTLVLQADLRRLLPTSRVAFEPRADDREGSYSVRILVSRDGLSWDEVRPLERSTSRTVVVDFPQRAVRHVRLELTADRASYQLTDGSATYVYVFSAASLRTYESRVRTRGDLVSAPRTIRDAAGRPQRSTRFVLDVTDEAPAGTSVDYYLAPDPDDPDRLVPLVPGVPTVLPGTAATRASGRPRRRLDADHAVLDLAVPTTGEARLIQESIAIYRNVAQDGVLVDGVPAGWRLEDHYYRCVFALDKAREIDFGRQYAYVDGVRLNGIQTVAAGEHVFRTHEMNWAEADSAASDPLYPYNHRFLVEGLKGCPRYPAPALLAADRLSLISAFDLFRNVGYDGARRYFALRGGEAVVKVPRPVVGGDADAGWRRERYLAVYRLTAPGVGTDTVRVVARMATNDRRVSPSLHGYVLSAGL